MQVTVLELPSPLVRFESAHGGGLAVWKGDPPAIGTTSFVEVDVDEDLSAGRIRPMTEGERPGFVLQDGRMIVRAAVEQVDEDGAATLRIASDALLLVDLPRAFRTPGLALALDVAPDRLQLWAYTL